MKTVAYYHYLCSTTQGARSAHGSSRQLSTLGPSSAWSCLPTSRKCEQDKIGSTVLGNRGLLNSNFLDGLNHQLGPVTSIPWRPGRSASTLSPWKLTSPSTGDFHWSPAPGRCPYSHHTCHGCPCEVRSISASGYGCNVFQKIHKYGTNEIMQMFPGGEANQERFWSHSNCLLPFVLPNFLLCHVQNID